MKKLLALVPLFFLASTLVLTPAALADSVTYDTSTSPSVGTAVNSGGFFVLCCGPGSDLYGANAFASGSSLSAFGAGYSDAGEVLFFGGGLTLGQLENVSVSASGSPLAVNLWLDTGGDGKFFTLGGLSGYEFAGLNGDSYAGCGAPSLTAASSCYMLGGNGAGGTFTLGQLQAGLDPGINAHTPVALWLGVTNSGGQTVNAEVDYITIRTASPTPEPSGLVLLGTGLLSVAGLARRRFFA